MEQPQPSTAKARVYRTNTFQRVFSLAFTGFGALFLVENWYGVLTGTREPNFLELMLPVAFVLAGALFTARAFRNFVCLSGSEIRAKGLANDTTLPFDRIKGRRRYLDKGDSEFPSVWHLVIEPNDDRFHKIDLQETYKFDDFFYRWFNALPDLDELDKTKPKPSNFGLF